ncbi:hypothetical protein PVAP13_8NG189302 [Panicum virgatum]|uniref:Uncharacterized protein n=1 Tax=Panicum virgatum TaxID=38727 RepID=A0A8T0PAW2_PANVG|nr:hypothetical protein PVAP13_8NG189302 [Panicum virgatum]
MALIFSILHRWRQRQEEAALAAAEVAFILQSAQGWASSLLLLQSPLPLRSRSRSHRCCVGDFNNSICAKNLKE